MNNYNTKFSKNQWLINGVLPAKGTGILYGDDEQINTMFAYQIATCLTCSDLDLSGQTEKSKKVLYMGNKANISKFNSWLSETEHKNAIKNNLSFCETDELVRQHRFDPISNLLIGMSNFMQFSGDHEYAPLIILDLSDQAFGDMNCIKQATRFVIGANFLQKSTGSTVLIAIDRSVCGFSSLFEESDFAIKSTTLDDLKSFGIRCTHMKSFLVMPLIFTKNLPEWGAII